MVAVFSSSNAVTPCSGFASSSYAGLDDTNPNTPRIPSAIDAGADYDTGKMGLSEIASFDSDNLEDFFVPISGVQIIVPPGAIVDEARRRSAIGFRAVLPYGREPDFHPVEASYPPPIARFNTSCRNLLKPKEFAIDPSWQGDCTIPGTVQRDGVASLVPGCGPDAGHLQPWSIT